MQIIRQSIERELPPRPGNPRNSEGAFLPLSDGRLAFVYSRYAGDSDRDSAYAEIALLIRENGVWSEPRVLARPDPDKGETNYMSVSLLRLSDGSIAVFYLIKHGRAVSEYHMRRSTDELATLLPDDTRCVPGLFPAYYVVNNDRVVRLRNGSLMIPVSVHYSSCGAGGSEEYDAHSVCTFYRSEDEGATWKQTSVPLDLPCGTVSRIGLQEPGLAELPGGALYAYFRTELGRQYESVSVDGGRSWFGPRPSVFSSPVSPMLIKENPYSGRYYAVWNPDPESPVRLPGAPVPKIWNGSRTPLVIAESEDGIRFGPPCVIEDDPMAGFCYPAMHFDSATELHLAYCCGGTDASDRTCLVHSRITSLTITPDPSLE